MRHVCLLLVALFPTPIVFAGNVQVKEIVYRGGIVKFAVPKHWVEEYEPDGGGMFYENAPDTGTLRLNVITVQSPTKLRTDSAYEALRSLKSINPKTIKRLPNGNAITTWVQHSSESGQAITLFWWQVTNPMPPRHMRSANFSYTVLTSQEHLPRTMSEVQLLNGSIENAVFHPSLGE
jgi:hypothetical protein